MRADGEERRPRSRDRYGRDRRERAPRETVEERQESAMKEDLMAQPAPAPAIRTTEAAPPSLELPVSTLAKPIEVSAPAAAPAAAAPRMPQVTSFELPLADLAQIAEGSGLHWVNSDADRVAQVQAAIAAEPKPLHVPRERAPVVELDEGPLVLVETRRDLSQVVLPFENTASANSDTRAS
jgi:ribonuclease E